MTFVIWVTFHTHILNRELYVASCDRVSTVSSVQTTECWQSQANAMQCSDEFDFDRRAIAWWIKYPLVLVTCLKAWWYLIADDSNEGKRC